MKMNRTLFASAIAAACLLAGASASRAVGNYTLGWGGNYDGQLTFNTNALTDAAMLAAGAYHSLAIVDGRIYGWGCGDGGALDYDASIRNVAFVAAGENSGLAIRNDGVAIFWGGTHNYDFRTGFAELSSGTYSSGALGSDHGLLLTPGGAVCAWGAPSNSMRAVSVPNAYWKSGFTAVAAGHDFSLGLSNGCVHVAAPLNDTLRISDVPAAAQSGITAIAAGYDHAMALTEDGAVVAWGAWFDEASASSRALPRASYGNVTNVPAAAQTNIVAISAGYRTCAALTADGEVIVWGMDESVGRRLKQIPAYAKQDIRQISLGYQHILVRSSHLPPEFIPDATLPYAHLETEYTASVPLRADPAATVSVLDARLLPAGIFLGADGTFSGIPTTLGTNKFSVVASNAYGSVTQEFAIVVRERVIQVPTFLTTELPAAVVGFPYSFQLEATENPTFTADVNLPAWLVLSPDGRLDGTPAASDVATNYPVFTAANVAGYANQLLPVAVTAQSADTPPIFGLDSIPDLPVGTPVSLDLCITGAYSVALSGDLHSEFSIQHDGDRWILSGAPTTNLQGNARSAIVTAANDGATVTTNYPVNIVGVPLWVTEHTLSPATPGSAYTNILEAVSATSYTATGNLPPGLSFSLRRNGDALVAVISGTLGETSATSFSIPVTASNAYGSSDRTFDIPVSSAAGDLAFTSIVASPKTSTVTLTWQSKSNPGAPTTATLVTSPDLTWPDSAHSIRTNSPATLTLPPAPAYFRLVVP